MSEKEMIDEESIALQSGGLAQFAALVFKVSGSTKTNDKGYFVFNNLDADKTYMAEIEGTEANLKNKSRYYLADKNSKISRITHENGPGHAT